MKQISSVIYDNGTSLRDAVSAYIWASYKEMGPLPIAEILWMSSDYGDLMSTIKETTRNTLDGHNFKG